MHHGGKLVASKVLSFGNRPSRQPGWTNAELAELYRVEHALAQAGIVIETDYGVTDEGDPWFVFCRECGDVVVHIARFGGYYRLYSPALITPLVGPSFTALTKVFVSGLRSPVQADANVSIHPAALLSVLIAAVIYSIDFHGGAAKASEATPGHEKIVPHSPHAVSGQDVPIELPARDTLFHNLVASIKALLQPSEVTGSQQFSFLFVVEIAATAAAMVGLSSLIEVSRYLKSEFFATTLADNHKCIAECQSDLVLPSQTKEKSSSEITSDASKSPIITISGLDNLQSGGDGKVDSASIILQNNFAPTKGVAINETSSASSLDSILMLGADHRVATTDSAQGDGGSIVTIRDGTYLIVANHAEATSAAQITDYSGAAAVNASSNQEFVSFAGNENNENVFLTQGDGSNIDLSAIGGANKITLNGNGNLQISDIVAGDLTQFVVSPGNTQTISLSFAAATSAIFTIQLNGSDNLSFAHFSTNAPTVQLTLDSEGSIANVVTISDQAVATTSKLDITVIGVQDLTLNESAAVFNNTTIDTSGLSGNLTVGLSLDNLFQSVDLSQVNASNFIVGDGGNIALLHAASGSHIQLASNLNIVDLTVAGAAIAAPGSLAIDLNSDAASAIMVNLLDVFYTSTLTLNSTGAGPGGVNSIETLADSSLSTLTITGDSALLVKSVNGPSASDSQDVTIDAHALTATLNLNVSDIADTASLGRSITLIGGSGTNILTNYTASEITTFVAGIGSNVVNVGEGAVKDTIVGLNSLDTVNIGAGTNSDVVINDIAVGPSQATFDAQTNLVAAAQMASNFAGSSAAQQAVLFSYQGSVYVFIDATGNHIFDASQDAIIKLVGVSATTANLAGVFHSA